MSSDSQHLTNELQSTAIAFEDYLMTSDVVWDQTIGTNEVLEFKAKYLLKCMKQPDPIRPCHMFGVNRSSLLGCASTVITYLVVLLQFKTTELFA
jgi:hypothetical protein